MAGVEHYNPTSHVKDTHALLLYIARLLMFYMESVNVGHKETNGALEHVATEYCNQLKTWTQDIEFATTIDQVSHHAFLVSHEDHNHMGAGENIL
jgi:hypothetical protein